MSDRNFDDLVEHFSRKIYQSEKGEIRLELVKYEMLRQLPQLLNGKELLRGKQLKSGEELRVLDVGGGLGQVSLWLAAMGHQVLYCDHARNRDQRL